MVLERGRVPQSPTTHVSKKLCVTIVLFIGILCISGGYVLGNEARNETKKKKDINTLNLTTAFDQLFKKSKRLTPKVIRAYDQEIITQRLLEIFRCESNECGRVNKYNVVDFVRNMVNFELSKLIRTINNASLYIDSLR